MSDTKILTPQELAQYRPEDPLPKLQSQFSLDLASSFRQAKLDGAVIVTGDSQKEETPLPISYATPVTPKVEVNQKKKRK